MQSSLLEQPSRVSKFSHLKWQVQQRNPYQENQLQKRLDQLLQQNLQLQQALKLEVILNAITDKLHHSLDENEILQITAVELTKALGIRCCHGVLGELQSNTCSLGNIHSCAVSKEQCPGFDEHCNPEIYSGLLHHQSPLFCSINPDPIFGQVTQLVCPIKDDDHSIGFLWLHDPSRRMLSEWELGLVEQVASVCACAIRRVRQYQAAQARITELEQLNREKDDFINLVAHELRSPMTGIRLSIQTLQSVLHQRENLCREALSCNQHLARCIHYLDILDKESQREITLLNDLLDLQRLETGYPSQQKLTPIQLDDWIEDVVEPFQRRALSRQQTLKLEIEPHLPSLVSDATILSRILSELLHNACKYTAPNATITLNISAQFNTIQFQVINTGNEIPPDELPRIFEKFYRVSDCDQWKQGGTGLGLSIVKKQVEHLGGSIEVNSAKQQTCFTVQLPFPNSLKRYA